MTTAAAARAHHFARWVTDDVLTVRRLAELGCSHSTTAARVSARRWQRFGQVIVLHGGPLTREQEWRVATLNCGPRAMLGSFSALQEVGLTGWERDEAHVLAPAGVARPTGMPFPLVLHRTIREVGTRFGGATQAPAGAAVLAAGSFPAPRPACGILAAVVQQRLATADELAVALGSAPRVRHRHDLSAAIGDIAMGAEALSEIDFVRLCRRHGLPEPDLQRVRREPSGRRRYLDAEWRRADGRRVVAEVDGALHLAVRQWWNDQLRQNEAVIAGARVLRFPSVVVRTDEVLVADQVRRALRA